MAATTRRVLVAAAAVVLPLALAACGDDDAGSDGGDTPEGAIVVDAEDSLRFSPDEIDAPAGEIVLALQNAGSLPHTLVIEDHEDELELSVAGSGAEDSGSITLEAGEYVFYCDIPGHRGGGMEGTLTVG
jgi:plastocyanin